MRVLSNLYIFLKTIWKNSSVYANIQCETNSGIFKFHHPSALIAYRWMVDEYKWWGRAKSLPFTQLVCPPRRPRLKLVCDVYMFVFNTSKKKKKYLSNSFVGRFIRSLDISTLSEIELLWLLGKMEKRQRVQAVKCEWNIWSPCKKIFICTFKNQNVINSGSV